VSSTALNEAFAAVLCLCAQIKNPYSQQELFAVRIEDSLGELSLVTDSEEWRFLREVLPLSCGPPIDASRPYGDMVFNDAGELLLMSQVTGLHSCVP
jgi:hypothetical protein